MAENQEENPDGNMSELRRDAIRRAREMQARAMLPPIEPHPGTESVPVSEPGAPPGGSAPTVKTVSSGTDRQSAPAKQGPSAQKAESARPASPVQGAPSEPPPPGGPAIGGALDFLLKDQEQTLILALLLILVEEKADSALIFAMMYLLF